MREGQEGWEAVAGEGLSSEREEERKLEFLFLS